MTPTLTSGIQLYLVHLRGRLISSINYGCAKIRWLLTRSPNKNQTVSPKAWTEIDQNFHRLAKAKCECQE